MDKPVTKGKNKLMFTRKSLNEFPCLVAKLNEGLFGSDVGNNHPRPLGG